MPDTEATGAEADLDAYLRRMLVSAGWRWCRRGPGRSA
jgi:hypothetical protein